MIREIFNRLLKDRYAFIGLVLIFLILGFSLFASLFLPYAPDFQDTNALLLAPFKSFGHIFGTDELGRDVLARIVEGTRVSLFLAITATVTALVIGTVYGGVSGYAGGRVDGFMMRIVDALYSFPDLLLLILLTTLLGRGLLGMYLALSTTSWVFIARLVRGEVLRLKETEYVTAARALGVPGKRILWREILPNLMGPLIVTLTFRIPLVILAESTLGFIGLGLTPPRASLGTMANAGWQHIRFNPHLIFEPALIIVLLVLAFNLVGDGLRDAADPRLSRHPD